MSSPLAKKNKHLLNKVLVFIHQAVSHTNRTDVLSSIISTQITSVLNNQSKLLCLDVGCGDMILVEKIHNLLDYTTWTCIDVHSNADVETDKKWQNYKTFDGENLPFGDKTYDLILFCDVLHHTKQKSLSLLMEASRVAEYVIIKDHFEYGFFSRQILRLMDFLGNWSYGVIVPTKYFSEREFELLCKKVGFKEIIRVDRLNLYDHLPLIKLILNPKWQFISVLKSN